MKAPITSYLTMLTVLLTIASCDNINRESKDVSTNAATLSADTLETMNLTTIDEADDDATDAAIVTEADAVEPTAATDDDGRTYTETEVVQIDTISTRIVYDIRRRMIEEVDTVGATKTYEIRKKVLRRTVSLDTLTETNDEERTVAYQKGDYEVLDEKVETDTAVEVLDYAEAKREAAKERAKVATTPARTTQPAKSTSPATARDSVTTPANQPSSAQSTTEAAADTTSTSRLPVRPSDNQRQPDENTPARPSTQTTPADTTGTDSGS